MCFSSPSVILTSPNSTVETSGAWSTRTPISPSAILATTRLASPSKIISSGVMIRQKSCRPSRLSSRASVTLSYLARLAGLTGRRGRLVLIWHARSLGFRVGGRLLLLAAYLPRLLDGFVDVADEVEGLFGQLVVTAFDDLLEGADRLVELDELALEAGELLCDEERLREEALQPARPANDDLVLLGELIDAKDGDDVLELLVALQ